MHSRDYMKTASSVIKTRTCNENEKLTHTKSIKDFLNRNTYFKKSFIVSKAKNKIKSFRNKNILKCIFKSKKKGCSMRKQKDMVVEAYSHKRNVIDSGCQSSINSNCSLEIISHMLTKSLSKSSSLEGSLSLTLWQMNQRSQRKQPNPIQVFAYYIMRKFKSSNSRVSRTSKYNSSALGISIMSKTSADTDCGANNKKSHAECPIKICDDPQNLKNRTVIRPGNKICGPGEILALLKLKEAGRVRHLGVSNVNAEQLRRLCAVEKPECLQIEMHLLCQQKALTAVAKELGVPVVAYSPLGSKALADALSVKTGRVYPNLLTLPAVVRIAEAHGRTPAQILLRHLLQSGVAAIPKSTNPTRIKQNISVWDFELTEEEMNELHALDRGEEGRICDFSFFLGIEKHPEFPFKK